MNAHDLVSEIYHKHEEWFEHVGDEKKHDLMINILAHMVLKERENNDFLEIRLREMERVACYRTQMNG